MQETVLLCKPCPMQRLLVQFVLTSARWADCNDGLRPAATQVLDKLSHTTEPGLQAYSLYFFKKEDIFVNKKKTAGILCAVVLAAAAVLALFYFNILGKNSTDEYAKLREGMTAWENVSVPGISLYVPEGYERVQNEYYTSYVKGSARVSLTSELVDNDLANYAYFAVRKYEDITDSFIIKNEYDEEISSTTVHVVEFDYGLSLDEGIETFSCLSAYVMGEGRSYILTCVTDQSDYASFSDDFHRIYRTMALTGTEQ